MTNTYINLRKIVKNEICVKKIFLAQNQNVLLRT